MKLFKFILFFSLFASTVCHKGFDAINPVSVEDFTCFKQSGYSFYIGRLYKSLGEVDAIVIENVKNARKAGFQFVDGYIFPCLAHYCPPAKEQIEKTLNWVANESGQINRLWISVQDGDLYWEPQKAFNQAFILEAVKQTAAMGYKVGIYTNSTHWETIVGKNWNAVANKPLWLDNWSGKQNFDDFVPFGGWKIPAMQQYNPNYKSTCGVEIDENWHP